MLPFVSEKAAGGPELLLDTCVYIDLLQHRAPEAVTNLLAARLSIAMRLARVEAGREQALLNDAALYLQAVEQGETVLTRNIREFDWFDQLLPNDRVLIYRQEAG